MYHRIKKVRGKDRKVCGVLAGISKHLDPDWDPLVIRLVFLGLAALSGFVFMFGMYFILALVLHDEDPPIKEPGDNEEPLDGEMFKEKE
ncbi:MAG TPA: PspC domain-containing protein [Candidatus Glassbacteria bacterium]|nr:PspC domain-containing protein [Candidatus Glassbacteria bacterium]